jgi:hypothetical protein
VLHKGSAFVLGIEGIGSIPITLIFVLLNRHSLIGKTVVSKIIVVGSIPTACNVFFFFSYFLLVFVFVVSMIFYGLFIFFFKLKVFQTKILGKRLVFFIFFSICFFFFDFFFSIFADVIELQLI